MLPKSLNWMRQRMKSTRFRSAVVLSLLALVVAFSVVQASGPMRPPHPPYPPQGGMGGPGWGMPHWRPPQNIWYPAIPVPKITIVAVTRDESVTFETQDFPENQDFTVTMGYFGTRGVNGYEVGSFNSGDGSSMQQTFTIPEELQGQYRIAIRASTDHAFPYYSYNWFYNNSTNGVMTETATGGVDEAAAEATEEAAEAAEETTEEGPAEEAAASLTGVVWQWTELTDPVQGTVMVENPEQYLVEFLPEGGMNIQADCNVGNGTYTADEAESGSISISIGAMTLALCAPESLSDQFVSLIGDAAVFSFLEGDLLLDLFADSGTLRFAPADIPTAETSESAEAGVGGVEGEEAGTILEVAQADGRFTTLLTALEAAGLSETLAGEEAYTVFAPPDEAFAALPEGLTVDDLLADAGGALTDILLYHVVPGAVTADMVVTLDSAETVQGEPITITVQDDQVLLNGTVMVVTTDIQASNGVIHVIDAVLVPPSMAPAVAPVGQISEPMVIAAVDLNQTEALGELWQAFAAVQEDTVPSFIICSVVKDETVSIVTENFPADQVFAVKMGIMPNYQAPMYPKPPAGPMPYGHPGQPDYGNSMGPQQGAPMQPGYGNSMGPQQGAPMQPGSGNSMGPQQGPPAPVGQYPQQMPVSMGMGQQHGYASYWQQPAPPKVWIAYYDAGTLESGEGGALEATFDIPAELAGAYRISIMLRTDDQFPYYSYNWFYNNTADVCNGNTNDS